MEGKTIEKSFDTQYLKDYLIDHGVKPSTIRIKVLEYLLKNRIHPTAEDIYNAVYEDIPTLSKTSVYNTIDLFLEKNIIQIINTGNKESRYDIDTSIHGHFSCNICNRVFDFDIDSIEYDKSILDGFIINEQKVLFKGICNSCK